MAQAPSVKICCISSLDEARLAISHGAAALGLVSAMPSGPGLLRGRHDTRPDYQLASRSGVALIL